MDYNILETRIEFQENKIYKVIVLVDCTGSSSKPYSDVRAIYATTERHGGYMNIPNGAELNAELLQEVAAAGMEAMGRDEIFPDWKKKLRILNS